MFWHRDCVYRLQHSRGCKGRTLGPHLGSVETLGETQVVEEPVVDGGHVDIFGGGAGAQPGQPDQDLPLVGGILVRSGEDRRRVVRHAVDGEVEDQVVVVGLLQRRRAGQDDVGMPRRLVALSG